VVVLLENLGLAVDGVVALALAVVVGVLAVVGGGLQPAGAADAPLAAAAVVFAHDPHWLRLLANPFGILAIPLPGETCGRDRRPPRSR